MFANLDRGSTNDDQKRRPGQRDEIDCERARGQEEETIATLQSETYQSLSAGGASMIGVRVHVDPLDAFSLPRRERLTVLRGQLTLLRLRCESDLPVTVESLAHAERLARSLEEELAT